MSPVQSVQVISPNGLEKLQVGQQVPIQYHSAGLTANRTVALINVDGGVVGSWLADSYQTPVYKQGAGSLTFPDPVDTSHVTNPAPQAVYQSMAYATNGYDRLSYTLPVPDGTYTIRLDFAESQVNTVGYRTFDIRLQGQTVESSYDVVADAGAWHTATALSFTVIAAGGTGILLELVSVKQQAILSGIELTQVNPSGAAAPTASLALSMDDGQTWLPLASGLALDSSGNGTYLWTPTVQTVSNTALIRITADQGTKPQAVSNRPFLITNSGHDYYVNDVSTTGDVFTTGVGNDANSGKTPDQPVASLRGLLADYDFQKGDVIHVDTGVYRDYRDIVITAQDSGVTIQGPAASVALLNRNNQNVGTTVFTIMGASDVTLDHLQLQGAIYGVLAPAGANSLRLTVSNDDVTLNSASGVFIDASNTDARVVGNRIHDNGGSYFPTDSGITVQAARGLVSDNEVFGNPNGIIAFYVNGAADGITVSGNTVHDNARYGIDTNGDVLVTGNTVFGQSAAGAIGILVFNNTVYYRYPGDPVEVSLNVVHDNSEGIVTDGVTSYNITLELNRVYHNSVDGIRVYNNVKVLGNQVYSNPIGIVAAGGFNGVIANNLDYANANQAIAVSASGAQIDNNDLYQPVGDAVLLQGGSQNVRLYNNIIWVLAGYDLNVSSDSQARFTSDYNLFNKGQSASAHVGFWNGATQDTFANWQNASAQDPHGLFADPGFVDIDGADNVLGYTTANGGYDGGLDDNFYLAKNSPAIDRGYSWPALVTDRLGVSRKDDPGTANTGSLDYAESALAPSQFPAPGTAQHFFAGQFGSSFVLSLPFAFPFYDASYNTVTVSSRGFLQFGGTLDPADGVNSDAKLLDNRLIAPFWANLRLDGPGNDVFVNTSVADQVTIEWNATSVADGSAVNVAVTLFMDGHIRFDYGAGNTNQSPTIGISFGNGQIELLSAHDGNQNLSNAAPVEFDLKKPGIVDIGAIEFPASSLQTAPPAVTSTFPAQIDAGSNTGDPISQLQISFGEAVNPTDANSPAVYELRKAGTNGFGSTDDVIYSLSPQYTPPSNVAANRFSSQTSAPGTVTLGINGLSAAGLPAGNYKLTIFSNATASIHDLAGLMLDGNGDGIPGGDFVRTFAIVPPQADVAVAVSVDNKLPIEGSTIHYTVTVSDAAGPQAAAGLTVTEKLPAGLTLVSATHGTGTSYDSSTGIWTIASLANGGTTTLILTAMINAGTVGQTITESAAITAAGQADPSSANNAASVPILVKPSADLAVSQTLDDTKPIEGEIIHYTITVDDKAGPEAASGVRLTDVLPAGVTFQGATPSTGTFDSTTGVWSLGALANRGTATLVIAAKVNKGTVTDLLTNSVAITGADQPDPVTANNSSSHGATVKASADVQVLMKLDNSSPAIGNIVTFTITASNKLGPEDANDLSISEILPDGLTLQSYSSTSGHYSPGDTPGDADDGGGDDDADADDPWYLISLPVGATATLTITASLDDDTAGQTIVNEAFVLQQDEIDPNKANNNASTSLTVLSEQQQPTTLSAVSGSGTYGGTASLTATLTAGGSGLAGKSVVFTRKVGAIVTTVGSATTDADGVATLTGVSLAGFKAGTFVGVIGASFALDAADAASTGARGLTVAKATPTASWLSPADITQGMALGTLQLDATASVAGTFAYSPASGTVLSVGQGQALTATFAPTDAADFNTITATTKINVAPTPPPPPPLVTIRGVHEQKLKLSRKKSVEVVVVSFSGALNAADAQELAAYQIAVPVKKSKAGAKPKQGAKVILSSAKYDPKAMTVTLTPRKPLPTKSLQLSINTALTVDAQGRPVDGNRDGQPGGAFVTTFAKAGINFASISKATTAHRASAEAIDTLLAPARNSSRGAAWDFALRQK